MLFTECWHHVVGLAPVTDAFAATVNSDVIDASEALHVAFRVYWGVGATGTTTITVQACDNTTPSTTSAVAFKYRRVSDAATSDVPGVVTAATSAGFLTTAGSNQVYWIEVDPAVLAATGYRYVRLHAVESVDSELLGGIDAFICPRVMRATPLSAID